MTLGITKLCHYAECHILFTITLNVIMLNVVMLSDIVLSVMAPKKFSAKDLLKIILSVLNPPTTDKEKSQRPVL